METVENEDPSLYLAGCAARDLKTVPLVHAADAKEQSKCAYNAPDN
jgi:hypothetical protein